MKAVLFLLTILTLTACVENQSQLWQQTGSILNGLNAVQQPLSDEEIVFGLKEALRVGTSRVTSQVGTQDGFNLDPAIHIVLPGELQKVKKQLDRIGLASLLDELELQLNRAAEAAAPRAEKIFWQAVRELSFNDILTIYKGPDDAATRYFRAEMTPALRREMQPVVSRSLAEVGAIRTYERVMLNYRALPFVPDVRSDLTTYVLDWGLEGMFYYLAREEKAIRHNPAKRTTEILRRVFGSY